MIYARAKKYAYILTFIDENDAVLARYGRIDKTEEELFYSIRNTAEKLLKNGHCNYESKMKEEH